MIESVPGLEVEQDVSLKLHWDADWSATDCRHGRAAPSHTFYLRTSVIPRSLTAAWQKSIKQKRGCGGVMVAGSTMTPHTVPDPHPTPPLGAPPQTSSEKNPRPCRDRPPAHFPRHSPSIRRDFSPTKAPLPDNARKSKGGPSLWLEVLQLNKAHRGQSRSRLDHRPGLLPCEKSPHLRVCGTKNLEGQAAGNKVSRTSLRARSHGHAFLSAMATGLALEPCGFKQARTATASADELDTPSGLAVAPNPSLFVSSSRFLVLMSAPSHQQHSSSRSSSSSNNRMDPRPHAGVTRPTTPPPKHCDIDMYIVRGWVTTTRRRHRRPHHPSPSTKILNPARPLGQPSPTHATPGAVFGRPPPRQPPTLGRVPGIVGGFLWTPCRRIPKPIPRKTRATPSTLFATPARQAPVPKATSARPLRPSVESRLSRAYCQPPTHESLRRPLAKM